MRSFKMRLAAFLSSFGLQPKITQKNLSAAVNGAIECNQDFAKRSEPKVNFFAQKLPDLAPVLNKLMQLKRVIDGA